MKSCFFLLNGDLKVIYASPPVENVLGGSPYLYNNMPFLDLIHPEERDAASSDFINFIKGKTLYGVATRCRAFNTKTQEFVVVNIYSNVVTDSLIYASIIKSSEFIPEKDTDFEQEIKQTATEEMEKLKDCLERLERDSPTPTSTDETFSTRVMVFYDTERLECKLIWPTENFLRLTGIPAEVVSSHTLESQNEERPAEIVSFVSDVRSVQKLDSNVTKRFCTIHHIIGQDSARRCIESVLEIQGDLTIILSELRSDKTPIYTNTTENVSIPRRMVPIDAKVGPPRTRQKYCQMCGTTESPEWRKGPMGERTLCNACGLRYSRSLKKKIKDPNREKPSEKTVKRSHQKE